MKKILAGLLAITLLAGSLPALAGPHGRGGHYYGPPAPRHHHYRGPGPIALGLAGLALGTVLYAIATPPVVAAPVAPAIVVPPPPPSARTAYFCESYQAYYPSIQHCPEGWRAVPGY